MLRWLRRKVFDVSSTGRKILRRFVDWEIDSIPIFSILISVSLLTLFDVSSIIGKNYSLRSFHSVSLFLLLLTFRRFWGLPSRFILL